MRWVVDRIRWIMLVSGALTCTMLYAAIAPQAALTSMFGEVLSGPLAEVVVRNWGALIALVGGMLIYGANRPVLRPLVLTVAAVSKLIFIGLLAAQGGRYLVRQVGIAAAVDLVMVALFIGYLTGVGRSKASA